MLKKLQSLKAKKGFTLVELIVVIAIIAVLAAILVPTMLGYVTSSRVTSANSTAASIKNNIDSFLTNADTAGYGMKQGAKINQILHITVSNSGGSATWSVDKATDTNFKSGSSIKWGANAGSATKDDAKSTATDAEKLLAIELANLFPEIKNAAIVVLLNGGKCVGVAYTADQNSKLTIGTDCPDVTCTDNSAALAFKPSYKWDDKTAGVTTSGIIVGTAPAIPLGSGTTSSTSTP